MITFEHGIACEKGSFGNSYAKKYGAFDFPATYENKSSLRQPSPVHLVGSGTLPNFKKLNGSPLKLNAGLSLHSVLPGGSSGEANSLSGCGSEGEISSGFVNKQVKVFTSNGHINGSERIPQERSSRNCGEMPHTAELTSESGYSTSSFGISRAEITRASCNEKKLQRVQMFSNRSIKKGRDHHKTSSREPLSKSSLGSHVDGNYHPILDASVPEGSLFPKNESLEGKKYQHHHQSSSSLDLDLDRTSAALNKARQDGLIGSSDRSAVPRLHREFGSQGSVDLISRHSSEIDGVQDPARKLSDEGSCGSGSPKPKPKRLPSKLRGDKEISSFLKKLYSGSKTDTSSSKNNSTKNSSVCVSTSLEFGPDTTDGKTNSSGTFMAGNAADESAASTPKTSAGMRATSLLCSTGGANADTSFSSTYAKVDDFIAECGSTELIADSRLSASASKCADIAQSSRSDVSSGGSDGIDGNSSSLLGLQKVAGTAASSSHAKDGNHSTNQRTSNHSKTNRNNTNNSSNLKSSNISHKPDKDPSDNNNSSDENSNNTGDSTASSDILSQCHQFLTEYFFRPAFVHHDVRSMSCALIPQYLQIILNAQYTADTGATAAANCIQRRNPDVQNNNSNNGNCYNSIPEHGAKDGNCNNNGGDAASFLADSSVVVSSQTAKDGDAIGRGDGRENELISSCPFFCNELGGESLRLVSFTRDAQLGDVINKAKAINKHKQQQKQVSHGRVINSSLNHKFPVHDSPSESSHDPSSDKLNALYILRHPSQYLHRPTLASCVGIVEPLSEVPFDVSVKAAKPSKGKNGKTSVSVPSASPVLGGPGVTRQELCPYMEAPARVEELDLVSSYYNTYFEGHEHQNYLGIDEAGLGPIAISYRREAISPEALQSSGTSSLPGSQAGTGSASENRAVPCFLHRIIIRTAQINTLQGCVVECSSSEGGSKKSSAGGGGVTTGGGGSGGGGRPGVKEVIEYVCPKLPLSCMYLANNSDKVSVALNKLDQLSDRRQFKIGVLYCKPGQTREEEIYSNRDGGPVFEEFLDMLGQRVRLKGFQKYRAGLDVKNDKCGQYSVYTTYQGCEVMFHVSTLLPLSPSSSLASPHYLFRKAMIGNNIVTIVFQEPGCEPFTPSILRSQFQHVFVVVRAAPSSSPHAPTQYSVSVSRFHTVPSFGPPLPSPPVFTKGEDFASFLLAKAINAELAALRSRKFASLTVRTRKDLLRDLAVTHCSTVPLDCPKPFTLKGFSRGRGSRRDKTRNLSFSASAAVLGAPSWSLLITDHTLDMQVVCTVGVSGGCVVVVEGGSGAVLLCVPNPSVLGWTLVPPRRIRLYYHQGECLELEARPEASLDEAHLTLHQIVSRLQAVTKGVHTQEVLVERNPRKGGGVQLGFHVQQDGVVTEVAPNGPAQKGGLVAGARIVEICMLPLATLTQGTMIDLLKTSQEVSLVVLPPHQETNAPRKGCDVPVCKFHVPSEDYDDLSHSDPSGGPRGTRDGRRGEDGTMGRTWDGGTTSSSRGGKMGTSAPSANRQDRSVSPPQSSNSSGCETGSSTLSLRGHGASQQQQQYKQQQQQQYKHQQQHHQQQPSYLHQNQHPWQQKQQHHPPEASSTPDVETSQQNHPGPQVGLPSKVPSNQAGSWTSSGRTNESPGEAALKNVTNDALRSSQELMYDTGSRTTQGRVGGAGLREPIYDTNQPIYDTNMSIYDANKSVYDKNQSVHNANQPIYDTNQSIYDTNQSVNNANQPIYDTNQSIYDTNQSVYDTNQSIYDTNQSTYDKNQSFYDSNKPTYGRKQSVYDSKPICERNNAKYETNQPIYDTKQPIYDTKQSIYEANHSIYDRNQPIYDTQQTYNANQSIYDTNQAIYDKKSSQSTYDNHQPTYDNHQPTYDNSQPTYDNPQPTYDNSQPTYDNPQPTYDNPQPSHNVHQPTYDKAHPGNPLRVLPLPEHPAPPLPARPHQVRHTPSTGTQSPSRSSGTQSPSSSTSHNNGSPSNPPVGDHTSKTGGEGDLTGKNAPPGGEGEHINFQHALVMWEKYKKPTNVSKPSPGLRPKPSFSTTRENVHNGPQYQHTALGGRAPSAGGEHSNYAVPSSHRGTSSSGGHCSPKASTAGKILSHPISAQSHAQSLLNQAQSCQSRSQFLQNQSQYSQNQSQYSQNQSQYSQNQSQYSQNQYQYSQSQSQYSQNQSQSSQNLSQSSQSQYQSFQNQISEKTPQGLQQNEPPPGPHNPAHPSPPTRATPDRDTRALRIVEHPKRRDTKRPNVALGRTVQQDLISLLSHDSCDKDDTSSNASSSDMTPHRTRPPITAAKPVLKDLSRPVKSHVNLDQRSSDTNKCSGQSKVNESNYYGEIVKAGQDSTSCDRKRDASFPNVLEQKRGNLKEIIKEIETPRVSSASSCQSKVQEKNVASYKAKVGLGETSQSLDCPMWDTKTEDSTPSSMPSLGRMKARSMDDPEGGAITPNIVQSMVHKYSGDNTLRKTSLRKQKNFEVDLGSNTTKETALHQVKEGKKIDSSLPSIAQNSNASHDSRKPSSFSQEHGGGESQGASTMSFWEQRIHGTRHTADRLPHQASVVRQVHIETQEDSSTPSGGYGTLTEGRSTPREGKESPNEEHAAPGKDAKEPLYAEGGEDGLPNPTAILNHLKGRVQRALLVGKLSTGGQGLAPPPTSASESKTKQELEAEWDRLVNAANAISRTMSPMSQGGHPYRPLPPAPPLNPPGGTDVSPTGGNQGPAPTPPEDSPLHERIDTAPHNPPLLPPSQGEAPRDEGGDLSRLQSRVVQLERQLAQERSRGHQLEKELHQLRAHNSQLRQDKREAARQLAHFTDWFFEVLDS